MIESELFFRLVRIIREAPTVGAVYIWKVFTLAHLWRLGERRSYERWVPENIGFHQGLVWALVKWFILDFSFRHLVSDFSWRDQLLPPSGKKISSLWREENFASFQENNPPYIFYISSDLMHLYLLFFPIFVQISKIFIKKSFCPPPRPLLKTPKRRAFSGYLVLNLRSVYCQKTLRAFWDRVH